MSGYLAASNLLKNSTRVCAIKANGLSENAKLYFRLLLHRYIRLTPLYVVSILISDVVASLVNDVSVYKLHFRDDLTCPQ